MNESSKRLVKHRHVFDVSGYAKAADGSTPSSPARGRVNRLEPGPVSPPFAGRKWVQIPPLPRGIHYLRRFNELENVANVPTIRGSVTVFRPGRARSPGDTGDFGGVGDRGMLYRWSQ